MTLQEAALASGATQLGEAPGEHYIMDAAQLQKFAEAILAEGEGEAAVPLPALPY